VAQAPLLLRQCEGTIASLTADGAYNRASIYQTAAAHQLGSASEVVIPPQANAVLSTAVSKQQAGVNATSNFWPSAAACVGSVRPNTAGAITRRPPCPATNI